MVWFTSTTVYTRVRTTQNRVSPWGSQFLLDSKPERSQTEKAGSSWLWPSLPVLGKQNRWSPFWGVCGGGEGSGGGAEEPGRTGPVAASTLWSNGEPPPHAGQAPSLLRAARSGQFNPLLLRLFLWGRGQGQLLVPQQQSLAELHCADRPAGRGGGGRKGGASPSRARPSQRRWEQEPWVTGGRGCLEGPGPSPEKKSRKGPVGMRGLLVDGLKGKEVLERGQ